MTDAESRRQAALAAVRTRGQHPWSDAEKAYVRRYWRTQQCKEIAETLGRTRSAVKTIIRRPAA